MEEKKHLPIYGVGPFYVITIIIITALGVIFSSTSPLSSGQFPSLNMSLLAFGIIFIAYAAILWVTAVFFSKIDTSITENHLQTTGVYAYVRNPIYSAFSIMCTGVILCFNNLWLLILPVIFWVFLTLLMINTEEKWLKAQYGQEYIDYCSRVNRCIPWCRGHQ